MAKRKEENTKKGEPQVPSINPVTTPSASNDISSIIVGGFGALINGELASNIGELGKNKNVSLATVISGLTTIATTMVDKLPLEISKAVIDANNQTIVPILQGAGSILSAIQDIHTLDNAAIIQHLASIGKSLSNVIQTTEGDTPESKIKIALEGEGDLSKIITSLDDLNQKLKSEDITTAKESLISMNEYLGMNSQLLANIDEVAKTAVQSRGNIQQITTANAEMAGSISEQAKFNTADIAKATEANAHLLVAVTGAALVLLFASWVYTKNPKLSEGAHRFTLDLAIFIGGFLVPIVIAQKIAKGDAALAFEEIGELVAVASLVMIIGSLFMLIPGLSQAALKFTGVFALFILAISIVAAIAQRIAGDKKNGMAFNEIGNFIIKAAAVMTIGALFMLAGKFPSLAIAFGMVFMQFLMIMMLPIVLMSIFLDDDIFKSVDAIGNYMIKATLVMGIGALFMLSKKFPSLAIQFGVVLMKFTFLILLPFILFGPWLTLGAPAMNALSNMVIKAAAVMVVGALFMYIPRFGVNALLFTLLLTMFIAGVCAPLLLFTKIQKHAFWAMWAFGGLVTKLSVILIVGALFMLTSGGKFAMAALAFTFLLVLYVSVMGLAFNILSKHSTNIIKGSVVAAELAKGIILLSIALILAKLAGDFITLGSLLKFVLTVGVLCLVFNFIGDKKISSQIRSGSTTAKHLAKGVALLSLSLLAVAFVANMLPDIVTLGKFLLVVSVLAAVFAILGNKTVSKYVKLGSATASEMGIGIAILSGSVMILALAASMLPDWGQLLKFTVAVALMAGVFTIIGIPEVAAFVLLGSSVAIDMGIGLALISGAFWILHLAMTVSNPWEDFTALAGALVVAGLVFAALGIMSPLIKPGSIAGAEMGISLGLLSGAFWILHLAMTVSEPWADFKALAGTLIIAGLVFTTLSVMSAFIVLGSVAGLTMSLALLSLSGAFMVLHKAVNDTDPWEDFNSLGEAVIAAGLVFTKLSLMSPLIVLGSAASLAMSLALLALSGVFKVIDVLLNEVPIEEEIDTMIIVMGKLGLLFMGLGILMVPITIGGIVTALMAPLILLLSASLTMMANAVTQAANMPDPGEAYDKIGSFFDLVWAFPSPIRVWRMYARIGCAGPLAMWMSSILARMGDAIAGIASLRIPIKWNEQGKPIEFRSLTNEDFSNAATNVGTIITTLGNALINVYSAKPELFDSGRNSTIFTVLRAANYMGYVIGSIAEGLKNYAALMFADQWNDEGKPIHFVKFTDQDFINASVGISTVLSSMGQAILDFIDKNPELVGYMEETRGGFLGLRKNPSKFAVVCTAGIQLGQLISGIAQGLQSYANMLFPDRWNDEGKPIHYSRVDEGIIKDAKTHIIDVLKTMAVAVNDAYWSIPGSPGQIADRINAFVPLGDLIANFATGLQGYANMVYPVEWNKDGKPIKYERMTGVDITLARLNIISTLRTMAVAVSDAYYSIPGSAEQIKERIEAFASVGELIGNFATGLQGYANLMIPDQWNNEGKPTHFIAIDDKKKFFEDAADNIKTILTTVANALISTYNDHKDIFNGKNDKLTKVIELGKGIGDVVNGVASGLTAYANLLIPDDWNKEGKPTHYRQITDTDITNAKTNIARLIVSMADAFILAYDDPSKVGIEVTSGNASPVKYLTSKDGKKMLKSLNEMLTQAGEITAIISDLIVNISNYKVPTGFDKDGKATGYKQIDSTAIETMKKNLAELLVAIPETIVDTCVTGEKSDLFSAKNQVVTSERNIIKTLNSAGNILGCLIENIEKLSKDDSLKVIQDVMKYSKKYSGKSSDVGISIDTIPGLFVDYAAITLGYLDLNNIFVGIKFAKVDSQKAINAIHAETDIMIEIAKSTVALSVFVKQMQIAINSIVASINAINDLTEAKHKLAVVVTDMKAFTALLADAFGGDLKQTKSKTIHGWFGLSKTFTYESKIDTKKILENIMWLNAAITAFSYTANKAEKISPASFENLGTSMDEFFQLADTLKAEGKVQTLHEINEEVETYIKHINTVDVGKLTRITSLVEKIDKLSSKMGSIDNFIELLDTKLTETLTKLSTEILHAETTIKKSDAIQEKRTQAINKSLTQVREIMSQSLHVEVKSADGNMEVTES